MGRNKTKDKQKGTGKKNKDAAVFKVAGVRKPKTKSVSTNLKKVSLPSLRTLYYCHIVNVVVCRVYEHSHIVIVLSSYCKCCNLSSLPTQSYCYCTIVSCKCCSLSSLRTQPCYCTIVYCKCCMYTHPVTNLKKVSLPSLRRQSCCYWTVVIL